ncbi:MAG: hypothetical protein P8I38_01815 [Arenicella sp.]|jgi:alkylation response protein AidB-like acyl-CoA dehydrogenase|nr:hypothetical protein [Arenicella sp.]
MQSHSVQPITHPVSVAHAQLSLMTEHAQEAQKIGKMTDPVFDSLKQSGLFQYMFPKRAGGYGHKLITQIETVATLGKADPSSAWAFSLLSSVTASMASMPPPISGDLFKRGDELFCSVAAPTGTATPCDDGYIVSGKWGYASGCMHADYAFNGVRILDDSGTTIGQGFAIIPLADSAQVQIEKTWDVAGMSASGSNTVVAAELFVPRHLVIDPVAMKAAAAQNPAAQAHLEPRDRWPMEPLFALVVLSPMLGAAQALLEQISCTMEKRPIIGWNYTDKLASQTFVQGLGQSAMEIDSAWMHIRRAVDDLDSKAQVQPLSGFDKSRIQADCGHAMGLLRTASARLMDIAGPAAFSNNSPLQRLWRDLNVGSRHTYLSCSLSEELYGRALTGGESSSTNILNLSTEAP